jgi:predicted acyltransferase (DUF342 family)
VKTGYGGSGYQYGAAGTIYIKDNNQYYGDLLINNNSQLGAATQVLDNNFATKYLYVGTGANLQVNSGLTFNLASTSLDILGTITNNGTFNATSALHIQEERSSTPGHLILITSIPQRWAAI